MEAVRNTKIVVEKTIYKKIIKKERNLSKNYAFFVFIANKINKYYIFLLITLFIESLEFKC